MRKFNDTQYRGLFNTTIYHSEVNADITGAEEGDYFINYGLGRLIFYKYGFVIVTNDARDYFTKEDLKCKFINEGQQWRKQKQRELLGQVMKEDEESGIYNEEAQSN